MNYGGFGFPYGGFGLPFGGFGFPFGKGFPSAAPFGFGFPASKFGSSFGAVPSTTVATSPFPFAI